MKAFIQDKVLDERGAMLRPGLYRNSVNLSSAYRRRIRQILCQMKETGMLSAHRCLSFLDARTANSIQTGAFYLEDETIDNFAPYLGESP